MASNGTYRVMDMTPASHTLYSICLFLSLVSLRLWAERRHGLSRRIQRGIRGDLPA